MCCEMRRVGNCCCSETGKMTHRSAACRHKSQTSEAGRGAKKGVYWGCNNQIRWQVRASKTMLASQTPWPGHRGAQRGAGYYGNSGDVQLLSSALGWSPCCLLCVSSCHSTALYPVSLLSFKGGTCRQHFCWLRCEWLTSIQFLLFLGQRGTAPANV